MNHELNVVSHFMKRAGNRAMQLAREGFQTYRKKDRSPVTSADLEVNQILYDGLLGSFPQDGWLSEESADDLKRLDIRRVWIIDPIDGTKYFIKGIPQFSISVALVENHQPILGAVFNPATDEFFSAIQGQGACLNGCPLPTDPFPFSRKLKVLMNPSRLQKGEFQAYEHLADCQPMGSIALTLAWVAAGRADAAINFDSINEWDIAAGTLLVAEAGGIAKDSQGHPLEFNQPQTRVRGIIASKHEAWGKVDNLVMQAEKSSS